MREGGKEVKTKYNLFSIYPQCNHLHAPSAFEWVTDGTGSIDVFIDWHIIQNQQHERNKPRIAILVEPRTIQPDTYEWLENNIKDFDLVFSHDEGVLAFPNTYPIYFMNWYECHDEPKDKDISMVCSAKVMCEQHKKRQELADILGDKVDHFGKYKTGRWASYKECRARYRFEVVVDNNWTGYWCSEKLANPLASKTIPIYLGGQHLPPDIDQNGIIIADNIEEIPGLVDDVLRNPKRIYMDRFTAVERNYNIIRRYKVFEDWFYTEYKSILEGLK